MVAWQIARLPHAFRPSQQASFIQRSPACSARGSATAAQDSPWPQPPPPRRSPACSRRGSASAAQRNAPSRGDCGLLCVLRTPTYELLRAAATRGSPRLGPTIARTACRENSVRKASAAWGHRSWNDAPARTPCRDESANVRRLFADPVQRKGNKQHYKNGLPAARFNHKPRRFVTEPNNRRGQCDEHDENDTIMHEQTKATKKNQQQCVRESDNAMWSHDARRCQCTWPSSRVLPLCREAFRIFQHLESKWEGEGEARGGLALQSDQRKHGSFRRCLICVRVSCPGPTTDQIMDYEKL